MQDMTEEQLLAIIYGDDQSDIDASISNSLIMFLRGETGDDLGLIGHYLASGSESAIIESRAALRPRVNAAVYKAKMSALEPTWDQSLSSMEADEIYSLPVALKQAWTFGNVLHELGIFEDKPRFRHRFERMLKTDIDQYDKRLNPDKATDAYWRGVALLTIVREEIKITPYDVGSHRIAKQFIKWSGEQKDLGLVYRTILERKTLDVEVLSRVFAMAEASPALGRGVL